MTQNRSYVAIGHGTIASLHDRKLGELGYYSVGVVEPDRKKAEAIRTTGARVCKNLTDAASLRPTFWLIRSPNDTHFEYLRAIGNLDSRAKILLEKPACLAEEVADCRNWSANHQGRVYVNENYRCSRAVNELNKIMDQRGFQPVRAYIEMSKDRRADVAAGRHLARNLLLYEGTHQLAILDALGMPMNGGGIVNARFTPMELPGRTLPKQGGFAATYTTPSGVEVHFLTSMDGKMMHEINLEGFRDETDVEGRISTRYRVIDMRDAEGNRLLARWEPIPKRNRSISVVELHPSDGGLIREVLSDDTMGASLSAAVNYFQNGGKNPSPLPEALGIVDSLEALEAAA